MHKKGSFKGLLSGFFWGLDSVILGIVLSFSMMLRLGAKASLITTFFHDSISFVFLFLLLIRMRKIKEFRKVLFSKSGITIVVAALLGGPIGMGGYIMGINYLGSPLASGISSIYPAMGVLLSYLFLKERMKKHSVFGMIMAIGAIVLMSLTPGESGNNLGLGIIFISLTVIGWGSEAVIINAALKEDVSSEVALAIRQMTSSVIYGLIIMPFIGYDSIGLIVTNLPIVSLISLSGVIGTISYLAYYESIGLIGATQAMGLNISYPAWAFFFQYFVDGNFNLYHFGLAIIIMIGSILSNDKPKEVLEIFKFRKL